MMDEVKLESAIPEHLRQVGGCPVNSNRGPLPYPTYVARFNPNITHVVMCYLGVQLAKGGNPKALSAALMSINELIGLTEGPAYSDHSTFRDNQDFETHVFGLFWRSESSYQKWMTSSLVHGWWESEQRETDEVGYFKEVFTPRITHFETHYATQEFQGVGHLADTMSGEIAEHAYWGAIRHRIPAAQYDSLSATGLPEVKIREGSTKRQFVIPHDNLCLIRSGQNWEHADSSEIQMYQEIILPSLLDGMEYLSEEGLDIGCFSNRFVMLLNDDYSMCKQSFGLSYWSGLDALEKWAATHKTHLKIFSAAQAYMQRLGSSAKLTTYHEVAVLTADQQCFEYINCHPHTGLLSLGVHGKE